jgi:uncharacterized membrane protein YdjX (TVP38/TMEM64 family)
MNPFKLLADDFTVQDLADFIDKVRVFYLNFGIFAAIGLPFVETIVPLLPLFLMLAFNILSYGLFWGYIYTYIGTAFGTVAVFLIMRYISTAKYKNSKKQNDKTKYYLDWIEHTHSLLHIIVLMIPFSPAWIINYSMGLSKMKLSTFILITFVSRALMLVGCIPFGMTLITLYKSGEFGGVQVMWLLLFGMIVLAGIVFGQMMNKRIKRREITE